MMNISIPILDYKIQKEIVKKTESIKHNVVNFTEISYKLEKNIEDIEIMYLWKIFSDDDYGWKNYRFSDCIDKFIDYRGRTPPLSIKGIPYITTANIKNDEINWSVEKYISEETYNDYMTRGIPKKGDVFFTMEAPLGQSAVLNNDNKFGLAQRILIMRPKKTIVKGEYINKVLKTPMIKKLINDASNQTTVQGISSKKLKNISIPIPKLNEQDIIVNKITNLENTLSLLRTYTKNRNELFFNLYKSVINNKFNLT